MTRAKDISKIVTDADLSGTLDVTGTVTAGDVAISSSVPILRFTDTDTNETATLQTSNAGHILLDASQGNASGSGGLYVRTQAQTLRALFGSNGDISFYEDTGTTPKLFWDASAEGLSLGTTDNPNSSPLYIRCATDDNIRIQQETHASIQAVNNAANAFTELKLDGSSLLLNSQSGGNVGIGTSSPADRFHVKLSSGQRVARFESNDNTSAHIAFKAPNTSFMPTVGVKDEDLYFSTGDAVERMRISSSGDFFVGKTTTNAQLNGVSFVVPDTQYAYYTFTNTRTDAQGDLVFLNRQGSDGNFIRFAQADSVEGQISVSGTTVSYGGGHLSRWSRLLDNSKDTSIVKGTVMTNLNEMVEWDDEANEQLNKMAVSSVEGDANVAGVFVDWDNSDDWNDMIVAMTGDMVVRIAQGTTVARGDLLMSAGDGTAKPQGDDIVRSKTIAKVTSTNVSHTYDDGTYLVPCVLMAC